MLCPQNLPLLTHNLCLFVLEEVKRLKLPHTLPQRLVCMFNSIMPCHKPTMEDQNEPFLIPRGLEPAHACESPKFLLL